ncbi:MAG TPA: hypothetical protein PLX98_11600 [Candidatus Aminicenantes bacterium]|nr:hypothetical protein [Candidatus Aminicenantes bacterium]
MGKRKGERIGWICGWLGAFLWVVVFAVIFFVQGRAVEGAVGLGIAALAVVLIFALAPWRYPARAFWKIMLPLYLVLFASAAWVIRVYGGLRGRRLPAWNLLFFIPILIPLGILGRRKWRDFDPAGGPDH